MSKIKKNNKKKIVDSIQIRKDLKDILNNSRYLHTLGVEKEAIMFAEKLGCDTDKASIAALLHDITKQLSKSEHIKLLTKYKIKLSKIENIPRLYHSITGEAVAHYEYGITDRDILNAIRYHITARTKMSLLEKIIYMADFTEENRKYQGVDDIRKLAYTDFEHGILCAMNFQIKEIINKDGIIYNRLISARNAQLLSMVDTMKYSYDINY